MLSAITGALAGFFHVLAGPDHLAAVAPLAIDGRGRGWIAGWTWGLGHASGVVVVALLAVLLRDALPPIDVISGWSERLVGAALIVVGVWALRRSMHRAQRTFTARCSTIICTSRQDHAGFAVWVIPTPLLSWRAARCCGRFAFSRRDSRARASYTHGSCDASPRSGRERWRP